MPISGIRITSVFLVTTCCFGADQSDLKALYDGHRWFELREALRKQKGTALYRGAVAAALQQIKEAERELKPLDTEDSRELLGAMYFRSGLYAEGAVLGHPEIADLRDQVVISREPSRVQGYIRDSALYAPVFVNGKGAKALIDSDMNMSFVCESEARRLGLRVLSPIGITGVTGQSKEGGNLAVADRFEIGKLRLGNVAFGVVSDNQPPFNDLPPGERVIVGLPVLLAMQKLGWQRDGTIDIGGGPARLNARPNLDIDGMDPVTRIEYRGRMLEMVLDMGSDTTHLWPRFAREFASVVEKGKRQSMTLNGISGSADVDSVELPEFQFRVTRSKVAMRPATVLIKMTTADSDRRYGRLGFNVLERGASVDFQAMTLRVDSYKH